MIRRIAGLVAAAVLLTAADDPRDQLKDPAQEARAKALFHEIRCVVCQNESIAGSEADIARDVRRLVREQIAAGRSDGEIKDYLRGRWGDFVLLRPRFSPMTAVLWILPFAIVAIGAGAIMLRRSRQGAVTAGADGELTAEELNALKQLQKDGGDPGAA